MKTDTGRAFVRALDADTVAQIIAESHRAELALRAESRSVPIASEAARAAREDLSTIKTLRCVLAAL